MLCVCIFMYVMLCLYSYSIYVYIYIHACGYTNIPHHQLQHTPPPKKKEHIDLRHGRFEAEMGRLQSTLTPTQRARLVLWVTR